MGWNIFKRKKKEESPVTSPSAPEQEPNAEAPEETPNSEMEAEPEAEPETGPEPETEEPQSDENESLPNAPVPDPIVQQAESTAEAVEEDVEEEANPPEQEQANAPEQEEANPPEQEQANPPQQEEANPPQQSESQEREEEQQEEAQNPNAKKKNIFKRTWSNLFPTEDEKKAKEIENFSKLNAMRQNYASFDKDEVKGGFPVEAFGKLGETFITNELNVGAELATGGLEAIIKSEPLLGLIGDVIKSSYTLLKRIVLGIKDYIKGSGEKNEDGSKKGMWQAFKDGLSNAKNQILSLGDEILGAVPFVRSIYSAIKAVAETVKFFVINSTRKRMNDNRRKFKEKYRDEKDGDESLVQKSTGFISRAKRFFRIKKTDVTVNKDLVKKRYRGGSGTGEALDAAKKKDYRQFLIDERLRKINKRRQIAKAKDVGSNAVDLVSNVLSDVSFVMTFTGPGAVSKAIIDSVNFGIGMTKTVLDATIDSADAAMMPERKEKAIEYTGILLEHIGEMSPFDQENEDVMEEYDHVESDLDATGVDTKDLYKKNGKKKEQQGLLIEALTD